MLTFDCKYMHIRASMRTLTRNAPDVARREPRAHDGNEPVHEFEEGNERDGICGEAGRT